MEATDLTVDEALAELAAFLADKPVPSGYYSANEILAQAKKDGVMLTRNMLTDRIKKGIDDGRIDRLETGGRVYYRMVKE